MKRFIIVIILCLPFVALAQNIKRDKKFINEVITEKERAEQQSIDEYLGTTKTNTRAKPRLTHLYEDSVGKSPIENLRTAIESYKRGVFHSMRNDSITYIDSVGKRSMIAANATYKLNPFGKWRVEGIIADSIIITEQERAYITSQIDGMQPGHVWGKGFLGNAERMSTDTLKKVISQTKGDPWHQLRKMGYDKSYQFSVPIYFRNDTYCLFYYGYDCGWLCGYGEVAIYKKVNGKWLHWSRLTSWVS